MIWNIAQAGLRTSAKRTDPEYIENADKLVDLFPCQLELGCGPSYEAGVYPLHTLHDIYSINEPFTKVFIMDAARDTFIAGLISNPIKSFEKTTEFYSKVVTAKLTDFYYTLQKIYKTGHVVGPILTNNFDGLHLRLGIPEIFIRTYDEVDVLPKLKFHPDAKTLLVIGCHADRRGIERRARERGLKVAYVDPEGWWVDGNFISYPLESPQKGDLILKKGATEAFKEIKDKLNL